MAAKPILATGVDAGSGGTRVVVCAVESGGIRYVGHGEAPAQGWEKGRVTDQKAVAASIREAAREAETCGGVLVDSAVVGTGGSTVGCGTTRGGYETGYRHEFGQAELNRVIEQASKVQYQDDQMLLHLCVQDFCVDGHPGHRNPRGAMGSRLEVYVNLVTFSIQEHHAIVGAANLAHLTVQETVFEPIAAAYAAIRPEQRREGVALIDIGAESSEMAVYYGDALLLASSIPVCGEHFTKDVARGLGLSYEDAEEVKIQHGCALLGLTSDSSIIEVPSPAGRKAREMPRRELNFILEARARQLFKYVLRELTRVRMEQFLVGGVLLCGGTARLNGLCDVADLVLNCQTRWGLPTGIKNWPAEIEDPAWTTAAGLAMYSGRLHLRETEAPRPGLLNRFLG